MKLLKRFKLVILISMAYVLLWAWSPEMGQGSGEFALDFLKEIAIIMPPVFLLMGLIEVWIPKEKIQSWLGDKSGIRGTAFAFILGTLPTGPLYVAFPMAGSLMRKGASVTNMVIFLGSWAALKITQIMVEIKFMGYGFAFARFVLTFAVIFIMGITMEMILKWSPDREWLDGESGRE
ncbi:MAG: permease [Bacillota bacterium]